MHRDSRTSGITLFLVLTFGLAWGALALVVVFPDWFNAVFGPMNARNPIFYLAVWSPNIAALVLTLLRGGWPGLRDLLARLVRWRVAAWVWVAAILFYPALMLVVQLVGLMTGAPLTGIDVWWYGVAGGLLSLPALALGPLGEELGWRGYLLPRVLERLSPLAAALVVGAIWMAWHLPAFFISGLPQDGMIIPIFMTGGLALSVFVTWLFVNARESVLVAGILPHAIVNAYGDATGAMTWLQVGVMVVAAILLVAVLGPSLRGRRGSPPSAHLPASRAAHPGSAQARRLGRFLGSISGAKSGTRLAPPGLTRARWRSRYSASMSEGPENLPSGTGPVGGLSSRPGRCQIALTSRTACEMLE